MSMPIILFSGTLCDEQLWEQVITRLYPSNKVIVKSIGTYPTWAEEVNHLAQDLPEEFILAGFSLGGIAALSLLKEYPERVKQLVLIASTALADPQISQTHRRGLFQQVKDSQNITEFALKQVSSIDKDNLGTVGIQFVIDMANRISLKQYFCQTELACMREDTRSVLSISNIPVHLIYGDGDKACGKDKQTLIMECCDTAYQHEAKKGGHWLPLTHPEFVADVFNSLKMK